MADELSQELLDILLEGVDRKRDDQNKRLKHLGKKHKYAILMGQDVIHHDDREAKQSVREARDEVYQSMKYQTLDQQLRNWDNRNIRERLEKEIRDIEVSRPLMEGVAGASLVDKKFNERKTGIDV